MTAGVAAGLLLMVGPAALPGTAAATHGGAGAGARAAGPVTPRVRTGSTPHVRAAVSPDDDTGAGASQLADAIADPSVVTGAEFVSEPPSGTPNALMTTPLAGFPTNGDSYALMTTGDASLAGTPNSAPDTGVDDGGGNVRGDTDYDVSVLKVDLNVPTGDNCLLGLDFRFLSEEYPEYVGTEYNDAFIAELDKSTWTTSGSTISAPDNFAFDPEHNPITINAAGVTSMTADQAAGTTYDGATPLLTAATPITPGAHSLYLSIFDQGDHIYDSAVMLDHLRLGAVADPATQCVPGAQPVSGGQVLLVHGVDQSSAVPIFTSLMDKIAAGAPGTTITRYDFYQDKSGILGAGCDAAAASQQPPSIPSYTGGLPINTSQNSPPHCDSEGDIGQNAVKLDEMVHSIYTATGQKVILAGYSMGGETIRSFLAYSTSVQDGVALNEVDSVVTMHGVQQGSWIATSSAALSKLPDWLGTPIDNFVHKFAPNPGRLATEEFNPDADYLHWVHAHSYALPNIPYYNTWGDERVSFDHCLLPGHHACVTTDLSQWGDVVLLPGTDSPTQDTILGGARFLPEGYTDHSWQWDELNRINWNPLTDPLSIGADRALINAPQQHSNIPKDQSQVMVKDCKDGSTVPVDEELARVIIARLQGTTYSCNPGEA